MIIVLFNNQYFHQYYSSISGGTTVSLTCQVHGINEEYEIAAANNVITAAMKEE